MDKSQEQSKKVKDVSLQELKDRLAEFARVRDWEQYHSPRNLLLALVSILIKLVQRHSMNTLIYIFSLLYIYKLGGYRSSHLYSYYGMRRHIFVYNVLYNMIRCRLVRWESYLKYFNGKGR